MTAIRHCGMTLAELLSMQHEYEQGHVHVVVVGDRGFHLAHTDDERAAGENTPACRFHGWLEGQDGPPAPPGVYVMVAHIPDAYSEPYGAEPFELFPWGAWNE